MSPAKKNEIGVLVPVSTKVPLSGDVDYTFMILGGKAKILRTFRCDSLTGLISYILIVFVHSVKVKILGKDGTHGDEFNWLILKEKEINELQLLREMKGK